MTPEQMKEALALESKASVLRRKLKEFVLLKRDAFTKEVVCLGAPTNFRDNEYRRVEVPLSDELRRYAFRLWKRETTLEYNEVCRKLAQLGVLTDHRVIPIPEAQP